MNEKDSSETVANDASEVRTQDGPAFRSIVCGVDGSRTAREAVRQAIALADPASALQFVCVRASGGQGQLRQSTISARRADQSLGQAMSLAGRAGIDASAQTVHSDEPASALVEAASGSELLVVASHSGSRAASILLGSVATAAVHHADVPVLVARVLPKGIDFLHRVLVASDGSPDAERGVELASQIARTHQSRIYFLAAGLRALPNAEQLGRHAASLTGEQGLEPTLLFKRGDPEDEIPRAAREERVGLVLVGSRGLSGVRALGSVSERVATHALCSVLVARPRPGDAT